MKNLLKISLLLLLAVGLTACDNDKSYEDPGLDVTLYNLSGTWQLETCNNGQPLAEGSYVYMELSYRDGNRITIYQNVDSFGPRRITGTFNIDTDEALGSIIFGEYDYGNGNWLHDYIVRNLFTSRMTWIATDDPQDVSVYKRCQEIPQEILDAYKDEIEAEESEE